MTRAVLVVAPELWRAFEEWVGATGAEMNRVQTSPGQIPRYTLTGRPQRGDTAPVLSAREFQVLGYAARGMSNREIGELLHLSEQTVKSHLRTLYQRIKARDRAHAVHIGHQLGLLPQGGGA